MKAIRREFVWTDANGAKWWRCAITCDELPDPLPTTGEGIDDLPDSARIAAGSVFITPDGNTVVYSDDFAYGGGGGFGIKSVQVLYGDDDVTSACIFDPTMPCVISDDAENLTLTVIMPGAPDDTYDLLITPTNATAFAFSGDPVTDEDFGALLMVQITMSGGVGSNEEYNIADRDGREIPFRVDISSEDPK